MKILKINSLCLWTVLMAPFISAMDHPFKQAQPFVPLYPLSFEHGISLIIKFLKTQSEHNTLQATKKS